MKPLFTLMACLLSLALSAQTIFDSDTLLEVKLKGDLRPLMNDRADNAREHPVTISYMDGDREVSIPISSRTRGNFRRKLGGCTYPPLMLLFRDTGKGNTLFREQRKLKLVVPCSGDDYIVKEYLAYRIHNLVTTKSFRARLIRLTLEDTKRGKASAPFYAMFLEEEEQLAARHNMISVEKNLTPVLTDTRTFLDMSVIEYLIGNTDWSVEYLQNVKLIAADSSSAPYTVPYDFDHSGLVNAPYAKPAEQLEMASVVQRRYRGYCLADLTRLQPSFQHFNNIRDKKYELFNSSPYLSAASKKSAIKYLDDFYATINDPNRMKRDFGYPCDKNGTGNVIIRGLEN